MTESITNQDIKPGMLVYFRHRQWVVLPSNDKDIVQLKPIGGSDAEATAVYRPLQLPSDSMYKAEFQYPEKKIWQIFNRLKFYTMPPNYLSEMLVVLSVVWAN
ncbi:hypothetical protein NXV08_13220 [Bacteroides fragilis]|nr:hypothetical protein [Bacteroides fragilis]